MTTEEQNKTQVFFFFFINIPDMLDKNITSPALLIWKTYRKVKSFILVIKIVYDL